MANHLGGDWSQEALEQFRNAYADRLVTPEEQDTDEYTGLPTNVVSNTSPWIEHTGLWKANDGMSRVFVPNQVLVKGKAALSEQDDSATELGDLSDSEIDDLLTELGLEDEELEDSEEGISEEELDELFASIEDETPEEEVEEDDIDALIEAILNGEDLEVLEGVVASGEEDPEGSEEEG